MINGKTSLIGLLGNPVDHSISPVIQNAAFKEMKLNWCYLAFPCETKAIPNVLQALRATNCQGLNITIPHKQTVKDLCSELLPIAKRLGAVNTLIPNHQGGWTGTNTDAEGFLSPLIASKWNGNQALVLGCGGSARAVVAGLQDLNIRTIKVIGRREDALNKFAKELTESCPSNSSTVLEGLLSTDEDLIDYIKDSELIVNTTPVGMYIKPETSPSNNQIPLGPEIWKNLTPKTTIYDLIYTPKPTTWLKYGSKVGCETIDGLEMLINQGAASLRLWSGQQEIPVKVMRRSAETYLSY